MSRTLTYAKAINEVVFQAMEIDKSVICYGLGVEMIPSVFLGSLHFGLGSDPTLCAIRKIYIANYDFFRKQYPRKIVKAGIDSYKIYGY